MISSKQQLIDLIESESQLEVEQNDPLDSPIVRRRQDARMVVSSGYWERIKKELLTLE